MGAAATANNDDDIKLTKKYAARRSSLLETDKLDTIRHLSTTSANGGSCSSSSSSLEATANIRTSFKLIIDVYVLYE